MCHQYDDTTTDRDSALDEWERENKKESDIVGDEMSKTLTSVYLCHNMTCIYLHLECNVNVNTGIIVT